MTPRKQYWQHLRAIHDITGIWIRRVSFTGAREIAFALQSGISDGYNTESALQRAYDCLAYNKRGTLVPHGELAWN